MNVYQENYSQQFIDDLPVNFNKIKNMDLDKVPKEYQCLFTTDWNWGNHSKMKMEKRIMYHEIYLEYCLYQSLIPKEVFIEDKIIQGFIDD